MPISEQDIRRIQDLDSFLDFLRDRLNWEIRDDLPTDDLFYDYTADEMRFDRATADKVKVRQLAPFVDGQPWGIFLIQTDTPRVYATHLRQILRALAPTVRTQRPNQIAWRAQNLLFVCATPQYDRFTFAHFKGDKTATAKLATFGWDKDEVGLRTLREFNLPALEWYRGTNPDEWIAKWTTAFDVAKVTNKFFQEYQKLFDWVKGELRVAREVNQRLTEERRHFFTQRLMNRLLFLCFLQKKLWLDYNPRYLFDLFDHCHELGASFYDEYLWYVLFLGLNRATHRAADGMPEKELRQRIGLLPFLNGGLFEQADEWDYYKKLDISNEVFDRILGPDGLLRRYNFTVTESTPLDVQVAIDPEMLGRVYEQLISERNKLGAFYTPLVEVRFMVRESLKAYLADRAAFSDAPDKIAALVDQERADALNETESLKVYRALLDAKVCDLAIGSGAFPVAMMREMVEILRRLARTIAEGNLRLVVQDKLDYPQSLYALKLYVIQNCIFGADIDAFAVEIAKLRFWLSLVVDNPMHFESRAEFEQRVGEIRPLPNLLYKIRVGDSVLAKVGKINWDVVEYKGLKGGKSKTVKTARNVYDLMSHGALEKIRQLKQDYFLMSDVEKQKRQAEIDRAEQDFERALLQGQAVPTDKDKNKHILWQVHFAEVFEGKDSGFDIMIANPPYVRQELLDKAYKDELADTYETLLPDFHADKKSDLYVYFYLRALYLLKPRGVLCFICSNSWLDVGYGAPLQEYLLKHTRILGIYDNSAKRSFQSAGINTTINIFQRAAPQTALENIARFVMFRQPFEEVAVAETLRAISRANEITSTDAYSVFPISQRQLLDEGSVNSEETRVNGYVGDKWGAKFLRAPNIYFVLIEKALFCKFRELASHIQRNNLQNLKNTKFVGREEDPDGFPFLHSVKDVDRIRIDPKRLPKVIPSRGQRNVTWLVPDVISNRFIGARLCFFEGGNFLVNDSFFIATFKRSYRKKTVLALMNSTVSLMMLEQLGRKNMGEGVLCIYGPELAGHLIPKPELFGAGHLQELERSYDAIAVRTVLPIFDEVTQPDRRTLDDIIFDAIGLTQGERDGVYEAVVELVQRRLEKAQSV